MPYSAFAVTNTLRELTSSPVTPHQLQQLLFVAYAKALKEGWLLHDDAAVKWTSGPAVPAVYHKLLAFEGYPVSRNIPVSSGVPIVPATDFRTRSHLLGVLRDFFEHSGAPLTKALTSSNVSWAQTPTGHVIPNEALLRQDFNVAGLLHTNS